MTNKAIQNIPWNRAFSFRCFQMIYIESLRCCLGPTPSVVIQIIIWLFLICTQFFVVYLDVHRSRFIFFHIEKPTIEHPLLSLGKIPDTHSIYLNYANPRYPTPNSDSDSDYLKLVWVIQVIHSGARTTQSLPSSLHFITCC
jgi:hypothetical protein